GARRGTRPGQLRRHLISSQQLVFDPGNGFNSISFRNFFRFLSEQFHDTGSGWLQSLRDVSHASDAEGRIEMPEIANSMPQKATNEMSPSIAAHRASSGNDSVVIAAALLGVALVLIAAQLVFAANNPDALKAAADMAASGIISP